MAAQSQTEPARLTLGNIGRSQEDGPAAVIEKTIPTSEPEIEEQAYSTRCTAQTEVNITAAGDTLAGTSMANTDGNVASVSMTEQLRGIGTSFAEGESQDRAHLLGQYSLPCRVQVRMTDTRHRRTHRYCRGHTWS
jgi:hypothetical protein